MVFRTNLATNPSFEATAGTVESPEGLRPVPATVINDGSPLIWQSSTRVKSGAFSAAFEWIDPTAGPFPDAFFPGTVYPS